MLTSQANSLSANSRGNLGFSVGVSLPAFGYTSPRRNSCQYNMGQCQRSQGDGRKKPARKLCMELRSTRYLGPNIAKQGCDATSGGRSETAACPRNSMRVGMRQRNAVMRWVAVEG